MADFCEQCTVEIFGEQYREKNDMRRLSMANDEMHAALCEHCGFHQFDRYGYRVPEPPEDYDLFAHNGEPNYYWTARERRWERVPPPGAGPVLWEGHEPL